MQYLLMIYDNEKVWTDMAEDASAPRCSAST